MRLTALLLALTGLLPLPAPAQAIFDEVPFVTTADHVTLEMLRVARVGPGDHVIDLGSGDGRIVVTAARQFGATGLGVEIVPDLVERSIRYARDAGVADKVSFKVQDLFQTDLSAASVITMYLLPQVNLALRPRLLALKPGTRIVSHDWDMADWKPDLTTEVPVPNKSVGLAKSSKIHTWMVPAAIDGAWCGTGALAGWGLQVTQRFQEVTMALSGPGSTPLSLLGKLAGPALRTEAAGLPAARWEAQGQSLRLQAFERGATPPAALAAGGAFQRPAAGSRCAT